MSSRISASGEPLRKSNPHVLMVQSTKHRSHFDAPGALNVPANGRVRRAGPGHKRTFCPSIVMSALPRKRTVRLAVCPLSAKSGH